MRRVDTKAVEYTVAMALRLLGKPESPMAESNSFVALGILLHEDIPAMLAELAALREIADEVRLSQFGYKCKLDALLDAYYADADAD